jgi:hypothetical protein
VLYFESVVEIQGRGSVTRALDSDDDCSKPSRTRSIGAEVHRRMQKADAQKKLSLGKASRRAALLEAACCPAVGGDVSAKPLPGAGHARNGKARPGQAVCWSGAGSTLHAPTMTANTSALPL